jgi:hypothetical protein
VQLTPLPTENLGSFIADPQTQPFIIVDNSMIFPDDLSAPPINEFIILIDRTVQIKPVDPPTTQALLDNYAQMERELEKLAHPLSCHVCSAVIAEIDRDYHSCFRSLDDSGAAFG